MKFSLAPCALISPDHWLKGFAEADLKPEAHSVILKHDAKRLTGPA